jgi:hypothetical protein
MELIVGVKSVKECLTTLDLQGGLENSVEKGISSNKLDGIII